MATPSDFSRIVDYIKDLSASFNRAKAKALIKTALIAERQARINSIKEFTGRNGRRLSGMLLNSIYSTVDVKKQILEAYVGVRNIPYGRIHEYGSGGLPGGVIKPVKAQHLWIPNHSVSKKMTPREFINLMKGNPGQYSIFGHANQVAAKWTGGYSIFDGKKLKVWSPLFFLVHQARIPARPYVTPAVEDAVNRYPMTLTQMMASEGIKG